MDAIAVGFERSAYEAADFTVILDQQDLGNGLDGGFSRACLYRVYAATRDLYKNHTAGSLFSVGHGNRRDIAMLDAIYIGLILAFFVLSGGLIRFCETLRGKGGKQ